jgi:hypothetical protein
MTNEELQELKINLRKQRLIRISNAVGAMRLEVGVDPLQINTIDALVRMAKTKPETLSNLFCLILSCTDCSKDAARDHLKYVCTKAGARLSVALFDEQSGHMQHIANTRSVSGIRSYVSYLLQDDWDNAVEKILDDYFTRCPDCGEWESADNMCGTYGGDDVCRRCIENEYEYSDYYDNYVHTESSRRALDRHGDEVIIHEDDNNFSWDDDEDCYVHREYGGRVIASYHSSKGDFNPIDSAWTKTNSFYIHKIVDISNPPPKYSRYLGVELEVEVKHGDRMDRATALNDVVNDGEVGKFCFFENDSSLSHGFEIITQPMGLDMHAKFWEWVRNSNLSRGLLSHNTSTCGLHVHVTRSGLSRLQLSKMVAFVNHPDNRPLLEALARRYGSNYATYNSNKRIANALRHAETRYEALNLESRRTVEFRMFKGTLKYESIMSAVEFANALVNFCSDQSGYGFKLDTKSFTQFLETPAMLNDTKHLRPYIANKLESE